jgi:hypothetical protein
MNKKKTYQSPDITVISMAPVAPLAASGTYETTNGISGNVTNGNIDFVINPGKEEGNEGDDADEGV